MKTNILVLTSLLALGLAFCGCNKSGKLNEASTFKPPAGPMEFKLKWPQGQRVEQELALQLNSKIMLPNQPPMTQTGTMAMAYGMTVLHANADGTHEIEMEFLSSKLQMTMAGKQVVDFDSAKKAEADKPDPVGKMLGKVIGSKIVYFLDATNAVERIEGVDDLMKRLSSGGNQAELASLKSMFSEGYLKQMMSANLMLPNKPVAPGDTWPVEVEFPMEMMGTMVVNYDFTFQRWEMHGKRECARLEFQGTVKTKPAAGGEAAPMTVTIKDGTTSGTAWFDPELGITVDTTANQSFKMNIQVPIPAGRGQPAKTQNIENEMDQVLSVKLVSVK